MDENLNKELNEEVKSLFYRMIRSWDKITNISGGYIYFDNGIRLSAFKKVPNEEITRIRSISLDDGIFTPSPARFSYDTVIPSTDRLIFYIDTPYKQYIVPEIIDRFEYAETLNILEDSLRKFERKMLSQYLEHLDENEFTDGIKLTD